MIFFMCIGAAAGTLLGALQPILSGTGAFNGVPILTAEYTLVGGTLGFALWNYSRLRKRLMQRVMEVTHQDNV
ncbi:hypothetical protein JST97_08825 [bacterium]|nr:hypothetical protein [bacterium]